MKDILLKVLYSALFMILLVGCANNNSSSNQNSQLSKYDRTPYAVYIYDGNKEIVLYQNPNTATVDGKSGSWSESHYGRIYERYGGRKGPLVYVVRYGSETLVVSPSEELIFFGTENEAEQNENNKYKWTNCTKKRL